jgi:hypothetical protein
VCLSPHDWSLKVGPKPGGGQNEFTIKVNLFHEQFHNDFSNIGSEKEQESIKAGDNLDALMTAKQDFNIICRAERAALLIAQT